VKKVKVRGEGEQWWIDLWNGRARRPRRAVYRIDPPL